MGACDFTQFQQGNDLKAAFGVARDSAAWEHGHGGYTGTLAEKYDVELRSKTTMTYNEASEFISRDIEENDKWGPAFAVRVKRENKDKPPTEGFIFYGYASS